MDLCRSGHLPCGMNPPCPGVPKVKSCQDHGDAAEARGCLRDRLRERVLVDPRHREGRESETAACRACRGPGRTRTLPCSNVPTRRVDDITRPNPGTHLPGKAHAERPTLASPRGNELPHLQPGRGRRNEPDRPHQTPARGLPADAGDPLRCDGDPPDHINAAWTLPPEDADVSRRRQNIMRRLTNASAPKGPQTHSMTGKRGQARATALVGAHDSRCRQGAQGHRLLPGAPGPAWAGR